MSQRYRQERAHNGHIADPTPLNLNNAEYASEWTYLDRDNVPIGCITEAMVIQGAFTTITDDPRSNTITLDTASVEWQRVDAASGAVINESTLTVTADSTIEVEWSGTWVWDTASGGVSRDATGEDAIQIRVTVDGVEVAASGWLGDSHQWEAIHLSGALPIQAGTRLVQVWAMTAHVRYRLGEGELFQLFGGTRNGVALMERNLVSIVDVR